MDAAFRLLVLLIVIFSFESSAVAAVRNVSFNECALPRDFSKQPFSKFFDSKRNIFEGVIEYTGQVPNRNIVATNECWTRIRVTKWYKSSVNQPEVAVIFNTDPTDLPKDNKGELYCPATEGESVVVFADDYRTQSGTGNTSFMLDNRCSLYFPVEGTGLLRNLLQRWIELDSMDQQ